MFNQTLFVALLVLFAGFLVWPYGGMAVLALLVVAALILLIPWQFPQAQGSRALSSSAEPPRPLIYVDTRMGVRPMINGRRLPVGYRTSCLYFGSGLIDRTETLDHGFAYKVLDPIPSLPAGTEVPVLATLVSDRARAIVAKARRKSVRIRLLWSGGIDSTAACCAILRHLGPDRDKLEVCYSAASRREYPDFFYKIVKPHLKRRKVSRITDVLEPGYLVVTGECGDQLFGSVKVIDQPLSRLQKPWQEELPNLLRESLASTARVDAMISYLAPQIARAPVPLPNLYELMWWLNFSLKWQVVTQRIDASAGEFRHRSLDGAVAHFFQTTGFQQWALVSPNDRVGSSWTQHKWLLKEIIYEFTRDRTYRDTKLKVPSLGGTLRMPFGVAGMAIDVSGRFHSEPLDTSLEARQSSRMMHGLATETDFDTKREVPLWAAIKGPGGE